MAKEYRKIWGVTIFFIFFLCVGFFCLQINKVSALEVQYPILNNGETLTASSTLPEFVKYWFDLGMFIGFFIVFLSITIAGAMYFLSPAIAQLKADAKDRIYGSISGLLILVLTYLIVTTINPQLSIFNLTPLPPTPPPPAATKAPGVYFYTSSDCSDSCGQFSASGDNAQAATSSNCTQPNKTNIPDLGPSLRNQINSVGIVQDANTQTSYISILYDNTNLWGECQYVTTTSANSSQGCQPLNSSSVKASSASIYQYNYHSDGDGVYFYRRSYFNDAGGSFKVSDSQINGIYIKSLEDLKFKGVPEDEQDCTKYDDDGNCTNRVAPSLGGENISSIKINGSYLVLLTYASPGQTCSTTPWLSCQEFPTSNDVNKFGPQQIKWQNIRNSGGIIPNCVIIIPIGNQ